LGDKVTIEFSSLLDCGYGDDPSNLTASATSGLPVSFAVISGLASITDNKLSITGAGELTVRAVQAGNINFNAAMPVDQTLMVNQADLVVTANDVTRVYPNGSPPLTGVITGIANSDAITATFNAFMPPPADEPPIYEQTWGSGINGTGPGEYFVPYAITMDGPGNGYIVDYQYNRVIKISAEIGLITSWGGMNGPSGIAVDGSGNVYITDGGNNRVLKLDTHGNYLHQWPVSSPNGIAIDNSDNIYVIDGLTRDIKIFDQNGNYLSSVGSRGTGDGQFDTPRGITVDTRGNLYVTDVPLNRVQKFDSNGTFLLKWGAAGADSGQFNSPRGIATDKLGNVYVADMNNDRVQKFDPAGTYLTLVGNEGQFRDVMDVAVHDNGTLFVADYGGKVVHKYRQPPPVMVTGAAPAGSYPVLPTLNDPGNRLANYRVTSNNGTLIVSRARPEINWNDPADITFGTALGSSQLNATTAISGSFEYSPAAGSVLDAGTHTIEVTFTPADIVNHETVTASVELTILGANQSINFAALIDKKYGDTPFTVSATTSSGLPVQFDLISGPAAIVDSQVVITGVGLVTLRASQPGNQNYAPADPVSQSFTVTKFTPNITSRLDKFMDLVIVGICQPEGAITINGNATRGSKCHGAPFCQPGAI